MDLLEFGMENKDSKSKIKRVLAKGALEAAKKQADLYEAYIERQEIEFPDDSQENAALLHSIYEKLKTSQNE